MSNSRADGTGTWASARFLADRDVMVAVTFMRLGVPIGTLLTAAFRLDDDRLIARLLYENVRASSSFENLPNRFASDLPALADSMFR